MKDLYKKILEKPEAYRRRLAIVITGIAGVIIFSVWLGMTYKSMQGIIGPSEDDEMEIDSDTEKGHAPSLEDRPTDGQTKPLDYSGSDIYQEKTKKAETLKNENSEKKN